MLNEASFSTNTLAWGRVKSLIAPVFTVMFSLPNHTLLKQNSPALSQMRHGHSCFDSLSSL